ncbi:MAG: GNAT family N-acetyltransferase [bacterium]|nr:GNAT family N-acetyltransferase [bacterium]
MANQPSLEYYPLTTERWDDFETLFGTKGACGGCWCMHWRLSRAEFDDNKGDGNRDAMLRLVNSGKVPGILAYSDGKPIGWCAVAPREEYAGLQRSRIFAPVDDQPVWSIVCLFVAKPFRRTGVSVGLIKSAVDFVKQNGGKIVEGYPNDNMTKPSPDPFIFTGIVSAFQKAGFIEALRRSNHRPIMRIIIQ